MEELKIYGCLVLALIAAFTLGGYSFAVVYEVREIQPHKWGLTTLLGLYFLVTFLDRYKK